jgi:4-amino-4-deoxy-L-arabinose transferase-like glycosyltransferase
MIKKIKKVNLKDLLPIILIILAGAFLRLYRIKDYIVFLGDEGRDALVVWNILHGHLTLLGPTASVGGFFLGPIYYYMMAPFLLLFNYDPVGPAVMVALFGLATIYLLYRVVTQFFGKPAGLIASLLYATSPIVVSFSRSSWNPNVVPFFTLATFYSLYKAEIKNSGKLFVLSGFLMGILLQLHYLATFVGAIMFFYVLFDSLIHKKLRTVVRKYLLLFVGFIIGFSPFLLFEIRHHFTNTLNVINFILKSGDTGAGGQFFPTITWVFERLFGGVGFSYPLRSNYYMFDHSKLNIWYLVFGLFSLTAVGFFLLRFYREKMWSKYLLILLWGIMGIGLFGLYKKPIYDYYLGFLFPLPFILFGLLLSNFLKNRASQIIVCLVIAAVVILNLNFSHLRTVPNKLVQQTQDISRFVESQTGNKPYNFALLSESNTDQAYRYFFRIDKRDPVEILPQFQDPKRKSVTDQLFVVCENPKCSPLGNSQWEVAGFGQADLAKEWDLTVVKVFKLVHSKAK